MSDIAIKVEGLSKLYQIGTQKSGSLGESLTDKWRWISGNQKSVTSEEFWALNDISFEIKQGEAVGIIGKNGAGKSTLLKILSRITEPTKGRIEINGRVASLLEVGTGFHPELSGRENIYLNGTILGMTRREIKAKFDEIVSFSGVEKFIDTPVKYYSSGMYVRLAFAVAAHLEPDILIIDEVLAVGDAEFQAKCLEKMETILTKENKTILFVSHSMTAVQSLCTNVIYFEKGKLVDQGETYSIINKYLNVNAKDSILYQSWTNPDEAPGNEYVRIKSAKVSKVDEPSKNKPITINDSIYLNFEFWNLKAEQNINLSIVLWSTSGQCIFNVVTESVIMDKGCFQGSCIIPEDLLNDDRYTVEIYVVKDKSIVLFRQQDVLLFEVNDGPREGRWYGKWIGAVRPKLNFQLKQIEDYQNV